jgi:hypothetical protein
LKCFQKKKKKEEEEEENKNLNPIAFFVLRILMSSNLNIKLLQHVSLISLTFDAKEDCWFWK